MIEQLRKVQVEWAWKQQGRINFISKLLKLEKKAEANLEELNDSMKEYHKVFGHQLLSLPREPVMSDFYTLSNKQHDRGLALIALSMIGIGGVL